MSAKWDKLVRGITADMEPGETILSAVKATPAGEAEAGILGAAAGVALGAGGFVGGAEAGAELGAEERSGTEAAGVASSKGRQVVVVLTDRRILVYTAGFSGKAKDFLGAIPLSEVSSVEMGTMKLFGQSMPQIYVTTTAGHTAGFGVAKIHKKLGVAFVEAYEGAAA